MARRRRVQVRASIHLPRLGVGEVATVDPDEPYIARLIESGKLVPLKPLPPKSSEPEAA